MIRLRFRPRRDVVCREAVELVTDYLEDALSQAQRRRFEAHLAGCSDCSEYLAQMLGGIPISQTEIVRPADVGLSAVNLGLRMAGRLGSDRVTVKGLKILAVDAATNEIIVSGAVPGKRGTLLEVVSQ